MDKEIVKKVMTDSMEDDNTIELSSEMLPEIKDWKVGEKYRLTEVVIEQVKAYAGDEDKVVAHFKIESVKANGKYKK